MAKKSFRLSVGSIFTKGPGKIYFYRYQVDGCRKTVSLQTTNRTEAIKKAQELLPVVHASSVEVIAAHVSQAKGLKEAERNLTLADGWAYYAQHPGRSTPSTVNVWKQYEANYQEFVEFIGDPNAFVRDISSIAGRITAFPAQRRSRNNSRENGERRQT